MGCHPGAFLESTELAVDEFDTQLSESSPTSFKTAGSFQEHLEPTRLDRMTDVEALKKHIGADIVWSSVTSVSMPLCQRRNDFSSSALTSMLSVVTVYIIQVFKGFIGFSPARASDEGVASDFIMSVGMGGMPRSIMV